MKARPDTVAVYSHRIGHGTEPAAGVLFSAGIHPWDASVANMEGALKYLAAAPIIAIGEIGLDFSADIDRERQTEVFSAQLRIAERRGLPVVIHCVRAYNEVLRILKEFTLPGVVFHGYTGSEQQTKTLLDAGYYISVGNRSLLSPKTAATLGALRPLDRIFAESDDDATQIAPIYKGIAGAMKVEEVSLEKSIMDNFKHVFRWTQ